MFNYFDDTLRLPLSLLINIVLIVIRKIKITCL